MAARSFPRVWRRDAVSEPDERSALSPLEMRRPANRAGYWLVFLLMFLLSLSMLFPLYWLFTGALKPPAEFLRRPPTFWPEQPQWDSYVRAWSRLNYTRYFANTVAITFGAWVLQMLVTTTAAFSLSKLKPAFGNFILFMFFATIMVPGAMLLIPRYLAVVNVPLFNVSLLQTWWAIWLPGAVNGFGIFLFKTFFDQISSDLTDAARIDGANPWQVYTRIMLPLAKPAVIVLTIGTVISTWQDFFWPFLVLQGAPEHNPIMVALYYFGNTRFGGNPLNLVIAASAIAAIPPLILFLIFQRYILRGTIVIGLQQ